MAKKKYYAVRKGKVRGIYLTLADCKKAISGVEDAVYQSFENPYEAMEFLIGGDCAKIRKKFLEVGEITLKTVESSEKNECSSLETIESDEKEKGTELIKLSSDPQKVKEDNPANKVQLELDLGVGKTPSKIEAYVDGSFDVKTKTYGSGVVLIEDGRVIEKISKKGDNEEKLSMRNVAGEIEAAQIAMQYCYDNGYDHLVLYFDYNGIEKWCTGEWKANKIGTKNYKAFCSEIKKKVKIDFVKVKAHTGVEFNEMADQLAKDSIF